MTLYAPPRPALDPQNLPGMELYTTTLFLEAESEPERGMEAGNSRGFVCKPAFGLDDSSDPYGKGTVGGML